MECHTELLALVLEDDAIVVDQADFVDEDHATADPHMHKTAEDHVLETERRPPTPWVFQEVVLAFSQGEERAKDILRALRGIYRVFPDRAASIATQVIPCYAALVAADSAKTIRSSPGSF